MFIVVSTFIFTTSLLGLVNSTSNLRLFVLYYAICGGDSYKNWGMPLHAPS
jgi:hypothetical protein